MNNSTESLNQTIYGGQLHPAQIVIDKYITILVLIIGVPGNILSLIIWMQKRMRHSSGYYLAALALNDLCFLVLAEIFDIHVTWMSANLLSYQVVCQLFPIIYMTVQYLSPCLVLTFTTERFISICHPFKRDKYCTKSRAQIVVVCLTVACCLLSAVNGYFFHLTTIEGAPDCDVRASVRKGGNLSFFQMYNIFADTAFFFVVPLGILVLNILVIREMRRLSRYEPTQLQTSSGQRTGSTTVMLLAVSFYQIITTLPVSVVYSLRFEFEASSTYYLVLTIIKEYGITHYAFNFIIYVLTGKMFRQELKRLFLHPFGKVASHFSSEYDSLRTSVHSSVRKTWGSVYGREKEEDKKVEPNETLL
ncbi:orphan G-protein coupled receptor 50 [Plakobranchus ocellatus]|uniref:Orphan G-protein coupled receptor 50 n=1 Tax=Plakobranchus ocellatus TaxID=259542 RepID=A0AAV3Z7V5_9GAST|nr:orphan G-protein coupled receptor 50 [Plakobranchus ocellatus]